MTYNSLPAWFEQLRRGGRIATTADAYSVSPLLYRATNLRADALSSVPYRLTYQGGDAEWPFVQNPAQLIKDIERALCLTGGAYLYKIYKGKRLTGFVPLNPTTMNVALMTDKATLENPLLGASFVQTINGKSYGPWTINDVVYFREPSYLDDIGPGIAPAHVALSNAKLEHYLSRFASAFFEGGAQPVTIMNMPEHMDEAEFQRFRTEMRSTMGGGIINAFKMIFMRAPDIKIEQLTPPINTMQMPELYERVITSVGMAYGVPRTMLEASAANYATAESDRQSFWRETVIPRLSMYEAVLNGQVFAPLGWEFTFTPEMMDVMQVDEASRAGSLLQLVQAGVPLRGAMTILGYDGIDEALGAVPAAPALLEPPPDTPPDSVAKRAEHWELLAKKIERRIKAGKSAVCGFESDAISQDEVKSVMARITPQMTVHEARHIVDEVKSVDDMTDDERRIYDKLVDEFRRRGEAWVRKILRGETVDPTLADIVAPVLNAELSRVAQAQIDTIGNDIGVPATDAAQDRVVDWLVDYVPMETRLIDATTAERIKKVIDAYRQTSGMTSQDVADMIRPSVDPARALMIARTETVRAQTQANVIYKDYLGQRGLNYERIWITERDDIACPICGPLDGKKEDEWGADFAGGPPAHPNCRCATALRLVRPAEPEPAPQEAEADLPEALRGSASEIADRIIRLIPESVQEAKAVDVRLRAELEDLYTQQSQSGDLFTQLQLQQQIAQKAAEIKKHAATLQREERIAFQAILPALQSQNPQQVQINFNQRFSTREQAEIAQWIQYTAGMASQSGNAININVELHTGRTSAAAYHPFTQTIYVRKNSPTSHIVHETVHAMQDQIRYGVQATNAYGDAKTAGKTPTTISKGYVTYRGITDDDYSYRVYGPNAQAKVGKWSELLTTAIENVTRWDSMKDRDLIELTTQIIKDGAK